MDNQTQQLKILELLSDGKFHSSLEMRNDLFIMQPATRIFELKEKGHIIIREMKPRNSDPNSTKIGWYKRCEIFLDIKSVPIQQELAI